MRLSNSIMTNLRSHVLQIAQAKPPAVEVIASFRDRSAATAYALYAHQNDITGHFEYLVMETDALQEARKKFRMNGE